MKQIMDRRKKLLTTSNGFVGFGTIKLTPDAHRENKPIVGSSHVLAIRAAVNLAPIINDIINKEKVFQVKTAKVLADLVALETKFQKKALAKRSQPAPAAVGEADVSAELAAFQEAEEARLAEKLYGKQGWRERATSTRFFQASADVAAVGEADISAELAAFQEAEQGAEQARLNQSQPG